MIVGVWPPKDMVKTVFGSQLGVLSIRVCERYFLGDDGGFMGCSKVDEPEYELLRISVEQRERAK